jgi:CAAX prenyl protease-like protein
MRAAIPRIVPFAVFIAFLALDGVLAKLAPTLGMDPRWWYGVRTVVVTGLLLWFWRDYGELRSFALRPADWLLGIAVGVVVFALWINLDIEPLTLGNGPGFDARQNGAIAWDLATMRTIGAALVVPVMEELFWRSFVMRWVQHQRFLELDPRQVGWKALAVSSAVFAVEHQLWLAGLVAGVAYGWLYMRTARLWVPILAHAVTNGALAGWVLYTGHWEFW